jgi:hypothetical protein
MRGAHAFAALALAGLAAGCKPPPTDSDAARATTAVSLQTPSAPRPSPDTTGAVWTPSAQKEGRIVYGIPGEPVLLALECLAAAPPATPAIRIARYAPADKDAGALLALIGNGAIGRLEVDAIRNGARQIWQGEAPADHPGWEALNGPREITATVPGAGLVRLNPSPLPMEFLADCRGALPAAPASAQ